MLDPKDSGGLSMVQEERLVRLNAVSILGVQKKTNQRLINNKTRPLCLIFKIKIRFWDQES